MNNEEKILEILVQMQTNITDLKSGQAQMQADITDLKSEQAQMRADITDLKSDQAQMRADITELKSEQAQMRADITELKSDVKALHNELEKGFQDTRSEIVDVVEAVSQKVERLENTIKSVEDVTAQNAFDVQLMKRRA